jgi:ABC-type oligopeptide transport system substrate-binding subunit
MTPQLPVGSVVAGYRILSLLGEGSTGSVYLAERDGESGRVALKLLGREFARDERFRKRFMRESDIAAGLDHAHVVPILDFGEADGDLYLAMRHVEGSDLRALLTRDGALDPARAVELLGQVAGALDDAHARGLVHRDVKPANILVERKAGTEQAFLADFGLAKHASSASSLTGERSFVGTISYVAPEQVKGEKVDARADQYSLGCVLYEALVGGPPFERESELAVVYAHLHELPPRASDVRPDLPEALDRVLRKAMAKEPRQRFASCGEAVAAAQAALSSPRPKRRRRKPLAALLATGGAVAITALAVGQGEKTHDTHPRSQRLAVAGTGVALVDPAHRRVVKSIALPERPSDIAFDRRSAWALLPQSQRVTEVDLATHRPVGRANLPFAAGAIAVAGSSLFATEARGGPGVARIDARTRRVTARWNVPTHGFRNSDPSGIASGAGSIWLTRGAEVVRVDGTSGRVVHRFPLPVTATLLAFANGRLWAASSQNGQVEEIDPATNRIAARAKLHGWVSALAVGDNSVWATVVPDDVVFRLSADDASIEATQPAGRDPAALSTAPGVLWVADGAGRALTRLDISTGRRTAMPLDGTPQMVREHVGLLWVSAAPDPPPAAGVVNGPELRVAVPDTLDLEPATGTPPELAQLLYSTCAKLLNYPDAPGAAGQQLVPDAAAAMPTVSADRRTYTFRIRGDLRFSPPSGAALDARTFKRTFERTLSPKVGPDPNALHLLGDVVGARAFQAGKANWVSGIVARGQTLSITLTRPAGDLPARLAQPTFCAVPPGTPIGTSEPIASAGPYYVRSQTADQTVLERNPGYRGRRPRVPARIVYLTGVPAAKAIALADGGRVDLVPWDFDLHGPLAPGGALDRGTRGSGRYRVAPAPGVDMIAFNTRRPLFRDPRLRRAVSYALDRRALAAVFDEQATDRYVPPAVPGAATTHVYPLGGPDLKSARRLAAPSGGKRRARLYFCGDPENLRVARLVRSNLRPLGIAVSIDQSEACLHGYDPSAARADILLVTRATEILDPVPFLRALAGDSFPFGSGLGPVTWTDRAFFSRLRAADALDGAARLAAFRRIEDGLLRSEAPYAAFGAFTAPEYFSARSGCRVLQGAYNFADLGTMCVTG